MLIASLLTTYAEGTVGLREFMQCMKVFYWQRTVAMRFSFSSMNTIQVWIMRSSFWCDQHANYDLPSPVTPSPCATIVTTTVTKYPCLPSVLKDAWGYTKREDVRAGSTITGLSLLAGLCMIQWCDSPKCLTSAGLLGGTGVAVSWYLRVLVIMENNLGYF